VGKKKKTQFYNPLPEFILEKKQEEIYLTYYDASKPLIAKKDKQSLSEYYKKADSLHLENHCKETFTQWLIKRFSRRYHAEPQTLAKALIQLYDFGLNFDLPSREGHTIFFELIISND